MDHSTLDIQPNENQKARHEALKREFLAGNMTTVISLADTALGHVHDDSEALFWKAAALLQQGKYSDAISYASEATSENGFSVRYFALLSLLYLKHRESESAVLVANKGLALQPNDLACLEIKAVALVSLFRLQEAHPVIQKLLLLKSSGTAHEQPVFSVDVDPEVFYEQALKIDPFKTKCRLDNFNTIKLQNTTYRLLRRVTLVDRSKAFTGLLILISLIFTVTYFFRDTATYRSFSPLLFMLLWRGMASEKAINAATNFKVFFRGEFRAMLQKSDTSITTKGTSCYILAFTGFVLWHSMQSWIGLVVAIIAAALVTTLEEDFATGNKLQSVPFRASKRKRMVFRQLDQLPYDDVYRMAMRNVPRQILSSGVTGKLFKYGLLILLVWPVLFMIVRIFTDAVPYDVLLYSELALVITIAINVSMYRMCSLRYFFPAEARRFVPPAHVRIARMVSFLWILLAGSVALHFIFQNQFVLIATGLVVFTIFRTSLMKRTPSTEDPDQKAQLLVYVQKQFSAQKHHQ